MSQDHIGHLYICRKLGGKEQQYPLFQEETIIGRGGDCQIRIALPSVSQQHCKLVMNKEKVTLIPISETNSVCVDGEQISGSTALAEHQKFSVGDRILYYTFSSGNNKTLQDMNSKSTSLLKSDVNKNCNLEDVKILTPIKKPSPSVSKVKAVSEQKKDPSTDVMKSGIPVSTTRSVSKIPKPSSTVKSNNGPSAEGTKAAVKNLSKIGLAARSPSPARKGVEKSVVITPKPPASISKLPGSSPLTRHLGISPLASGGKAVPSALSRIPGSKTPVQRPMSTQKVVLSNKKPPLPATPASCSRKVMSRVGATSAVPKTPLTTTNLKATTPKSTTATPVSGKRATPGSAKDGSESKAPRRVSKTPQSQGKRATPGRQPLRKSPSPSLLLSGGAKNRRQLRTPISGQKVAKTAALQVNSSGKKATTPSSRKRKSDSPLFTEEEALTNVTPLFCPSSPPEGMGPEAVPSVPSVNQSVALITFESPTVDVMQSKDLEVESSKGKSRRSESFSLALDSFQTPDAEMGSSNSKKRLSRAGSAKMSPKDVDGGMSSQIANEEAPNEFPQTSLASFQSIPDSGGSRRRSSRRSGVLVLALNDSTHQTPGMNEENTSSAKRRRSSASRKEGDGKVSTLIASTPMISATNQKLSTEEISSPCQETISPIRKRASSIWVGNDSSSEADEPDDHPMSENTPSKRSKNVSFALKESEPRIASKSVRKTPGKALSLPELDESNLANTNQSSTSRRSSSRRSVRGTPYTPSLDISTPAVGSDESLVANSYMSPQLADSPFVSIAPAGTPVQRLNLSEVSSCVSSERSTQPKSRSQRKKSIGSEAGSVKHSPVIKGRSRQQGTPDLSLNLTVDSLSTGKTICSVKKRRRSSRATPGSSASARSLEKTAVSTPGSLILNLSGETDAEKVDVYEFKEVDVESSPEQVLTPFGLTPFRQQGRRSLNVEESPMTTTSFSATRSNSAEPLKSSVKNSGKKADLRRVVQLRAIKRRSESPRSPGKKVLKMQLDALKRNSIAVIPVHESVLPEGDENEMTTSFISVSTPEPSVQVSEWSDAVTTPGQNTTTTTVGAHRSSLGAFFTTDSNSSRRSERIRESVASQGHLDQSTGEVAQSDKPRKSVGLVGVKELLHQELELTASPQLAGLKELMTEDAVANSKSPRLAGLKRLVKTPKVVSRKSTYAGMKEMFVPSPEVNSPQLKGLKEMMHTPPAIHSPDLIGMKQLMKSPRKSARYSGLGLLFQSSEESVAVGQAPKEGSAKKQSKRTSILATPKHEVRPAPTPKTGGSYLDVTQNLGTPIQVEDAQSVPRRRLPSRMASAKASAKITAVSCNSPRTRANAPTANQIIAPDFNKQLEPDVEEAVETDVSPALPTKRATRGRKPTAKAPAARVSQKKTRKTKEVLVESEELTPTDVEEAQVEPPKRATRGKRVSVEKKEPETESETKRTRAKKEPKTVTSVSEQQPEAAKPKARVTKASKQKATDGSDSSNLDNEIQETEETLQPKRGRATRAKKAAVKQVSPVKVLRKTVAIQTPEVVEETKNTRPRRTTAKNRRSSSAGIAFKTRRRSSIAPVLVKTSKRKRQVKASQEPESDMPSEEQTVAKKPATRRGKKVEKDDDAGEENNTTTSEDKKTRQKVKRGNKESPAKKTKSKELSPPKPRVTRARAAKK